MSKRGRRKKIKLNVRPETVKSIFAVILILVGFLFLWSLISPTYNLTSLVYQNLKKFLGIGMYLIPFSFITTGILLLWPVNYKLLNLRIVIGSYFMVILISTLSESFFVKSGGFLGLNILRIMENNIGYVGSLIVLFFLFFANLIFISDVSGPMAQDFMNRLKLRFSRNNPENQEVEEEESEVINDDTEPNEEDLEEKGLVRGSVFTKVPSFSEPVAGSETLASISAIKPTSSNKDSSSKEVFPGSRDRIWEYPPLTLLDDTGELVFDSGNVKENSAKIEETLRKFNINSKVVEVCPGPTVTQYALEVESQSRINTITSLGTDLMYALASPGELRIQVPIPGRSLVGIEVPNKVRSKVGVRTLFSGEKMKKAKDKLTIALGLDVAGKEVTYSIAKMPHLLVAGETGSGKSVFLHALIFSILFKNSPDECKLIIIDPKTNEFHFYSDIPHLITPVVTDMSKVPAILEWASIEMNRRYKMFKDAKARNIDDYNERSGFQALPNIVIIADELAQLLLNDPAKSLKALQELTQLARAAGIHLVLATQRPDTKIITGTIKANIPARIAFSVGSQVDSRVVLDGPGAEKLLKHGDMLFSAPDTSKFERIQGAFITNAEIGKVVDFICNQGIKPEYNEEILKTSSKSQLSIATDADSRDEYYEQAKEIAIMARKISASLLQRRLSIGYARAAKILDQLEAGGIVGPQSGSKPREVLLGYTDDLTNDNNDNEDSELESDNNFEKTEVTSA